MELGCSLDKNQAPHSRGFLFVKMMMGQQRGTGRYKKADRHCCVIFCRFGQYEEISIYSINIL